jgi:hypothetical protein
MNTRVERKEEAVVTIEVAGDPAGLRALAGPSMRNVCTHEGYYAYSERSTRPSRKECRRDLSPTEGAAGAP